MNWKVILASAISVIIGMIIYDRFVKNLIPAAFEGNYFDYDEYKEAS